MTPQSVFMIGWEFPPHHSGGLGVACRGLSQSLLSLGQPVTFTLPKFLGGGRRPQHAQYVHDSGQIMEMVYVDSWLEPYTRGPANNLQWAGDIVTEVQRYGDEVAGIAKQSIEKPKLIHAHDWLSIPGGIRAKRAVGKPLVLHIHSTEYDRSGGGSPHPAIAEIEYQGLTEADHVVAVSQYTKDLIVEKYGIPADRITVVHNGVDPNPEYHDQTLTAFLQSRPVVAFVGRLTIQKGPEYFLSVAKRVIAQEPKAVFVLAGHGDMYRSLMVSSAAQGLSGSVLFAGFLRDKEKQSVYERANVFVMPSVSEPFGIAALEAAMAHTPVIVSKTSGVREVLPHAFAIDFWDIDLMTKTIVDCIRHPELSTQRASAVADEARQLRWDDAGKKLHSLYAKILG